MSDLSRLAWDDLRVVLEVARQGSIYGAAKILKVNHSTVTRRVALVENIMERRLFDRSNRGIKPRPETESLLKYIRTMEVQAAGLIDEFGLSLDSKKQIIRIATMEGLASGYFARRIQTIAPPSSDIYIELFSNPHIVDLLKKETDIFLSFFNPSIPGLISEKIGDVAIYLYGSDRYRREHGLPRSRAELSAHRFVGYIDEMVSIESIRWLQELVAHPNVVFSSNSVIAQRNAVIAGAGLAVLPVFVCEEVKTLFRVLPDEVRLTRPIWMSVGRDQYFLKSFKQTAKAIARTFNADKKFLLGKSPTLD